jgi:hypothetical protein
MVSWLWYAATRRSMACSTTSLNSDAMAPWNVSRTCLTMSLWPFLTSVCSTVVMVSSRMQTTMRSSSR